MHLIVDARGRSLIRLLADVEMQTISVGDILCESEDGSWIAECKTAQDLANSIVDGRWHEQKHRLLQSGYPFGCL